MSLYNGLNSALSVRETPLAATIAAAMVWSSSLLAFVLDVMFCSLMTFAGGRCFAADRTFTIYKMIVGYWLVFFAVRNRGVPVDRSQINAGSHHSGADVIVKRVIVVRKNISVLGFDFFSEFKFLFACEFHVKPFLLYVSIIFKSLDLSIGKIYVNLCRFLGNIEFEIVTQHLSAIVQTGKA